VDARGKEGRSVLEKQKERVGLSQFHPWRTGVVGENQEGASANVAGEGTQERNPKRKRDVGLWGEERQAQVPKIGSEKGALTLITEIKKHKRMIMKARG